MVELLHDFCHRKIKLLMSDKAALPGCTFSGCHYKWKSVAFQLKEKKKQMRGFQIFSNLFHVLPFQPLLGKSTTGYLLLSFYIRASQHLTLDYAIFFTFVLMLLSEVLFKKKYSYMESTCLLLFVVPRAPKKHHFHSFHLFPLPIPPTETSFKSFIHN